MKQFDEKALGARITRLRQEKGLLQKQMAKELNLSVSFYGHIERGGRTPSLPTLVHIANYLGVGADSLLRDSLEAPCLPKRSFTDRELYMLRQIIEGQNGEDDSWFPVEEK